MGMRSQDIGFARIHFWQFYEHLPAYTGSRPGSLQESFPGPALVGKGVEQCEAPILLPIS